MHSRIRDRGRLFNAVKLHQTQYDDDDGGDARSVIQWIIGLLHIGSKDQNKILWAFVFTFGRYC